MVPWPSAKIRAMAPQLTSHDPAWVSLYEGERTLLEQALGGAAVGGIHHVGSTSVPSVDAEPVIDILAGVPDLPLAGEHLHSLIELGYSPAPGFSPDIQPLCKPHLERRTFELHLVPVTSAHFAGMLAFRDFLRNHCQAAIAYTWMKRDLANRHQSNRQRYLAAKGELIEVILAGLGPR